MIFTGALLLGLMGSVHCLGMCGPIALALPVGKLSPGGKITAAFLHQFGRTLTYMVLGILFGLLGKGFAMAGFQQWVSIAMGGLMIAMAFIPMLQGKTYAAFRPLTRLSGWLKKPMGVFLKQRTPSGFLVLGLLNGLLPCGLVYVALAGSMAAGSPWTGALFMGLFGLGTSPALFATTLAGGYLNANFRLRLQRLIPATMVIVGLLFVFRGLGLGIPYISPNPNALQIEATQSCCSKDDPAPACH
jgi:sulfite exporter TauE/SafE